jgi:hypothetical protein
MLQLRHDGARQRPVVSEQGPIRCHVAPKEPPYLWCPKLSDCGTSVLLSLQIASCEHGQIDWIGSRAGQLVKIRDLDLLGRDPWSHESHEMRHEMG